MTAAAGPAAATMAAVRRRLVRGVLIVLLAAMTAFGAVLLAGAKDEGDAQAVYNSLPRCPDSGHPEAAGCWTAVSATVVDRRATFGANGLRHDVLDLRVAGHLAVADVEPVTAFTCLGGGDPVVLRFWRGALTSVYTTHGLVPTRANPNVGATDRLEEGVILVGVAVMVALSVLLVRRRRARSVALSMRTLLGRRDVRLCLVLFGVGQLADVVTSAVGQRAGLIEGNAAVDDFIQVVGPAGFLLFRLPIIVLFLLGVLRLPRVALLGVLAGAAAYFGATGAHNLVLAMAAGQAPVSGCATVLLP